MPITYGFKKHFYILLAEMKRANIAPELLFNILKSLTKERDDDRRVEYDIFIYQTLLPDFFKAKDMNMISYIFNAIITVITKKMDWVMTFIPDDIYMLIMFNKILMKHNKIFSEKAFNLIDEDKENNKILLYRYQCGCCIGTQSIYGSCNRINRKLFI
jgi:hypothetical protein